MSGTPKTRRRHELRKKWETRDGNLEKKLEFQELRIKRLRKTGSFKSWMENAKDGNISRSMNSPHIQTQTLKFLEYAQYHAMSQCWHASIPSTETPHE